MADQMIELKVNGRDVQAPREQLLIHLLRELGIRVPTLCHDDRLSPYGGCRLCVVERRDGRGGLVPSCSTPVLPGMEIETDTEAVLNSRRSQLQLLVLNHRMECPSCERRADCRFQDLLYEIGTPEDVLPFELVRGARVTSSPVIERDPEKCLVCGRCVRMCSEVQGVAAIGLIERGLESRVATFEDRALDCEFCGQCVNTCPVGALVARPYVSDVPPWLRTSIATTCSFCPCGCEVEVASFDNRIVRVTGRPGSEPNQGRLCAKGWLGLDVLSSPERLTAPLVRRDDQLVEASWEEALAAAGVALRVAKDAGGALLALAGCQLTSEDGYRLQRLVRGAVGSPQVHTTAVGGVRALTDGLEAMLDRPRSSAGYAQLAAADLVFMLRADPTRTHPLVKTEIVQGILRRGQRLVTAHALSGGLDRHAERSLRVTAGSEANLLNGLAALVLAGAADLFARVAGIAGADEWRRSLAPFTLAVTARLTGLDGAEIERLAATLLAAERPVIGVVTGLGIPGDEVLAARAAAALTALLAPRAGLMLLSEQTNVQGLVDVGLHPALLPGHRRAAEATHRQEIERLTGVELPPTAGLALEQALARAAQGAITTMWLLGSDALSTVPSREVFEAAAAAAGHVIVQDAFLTDEARLADVVLPVSLLSERRGSTVGWDGERRPLVPAIQAPGVPGDGQLIAELARRLGAPQPDDETLAAELEAVIGWPLPRPELQRLVPVPEPVAARVGEGLLLDASPQLFHSAAVTLRAARLQELSPTVAVRLHPEDANELGVDRGDLVDIVGRGAEMQLRARLDRRVRPGTVVVHRYGPHNAALSMMSDDVEPSFVRVRRS